MFVLADAADPNGYLGIILGAGAILGGIGYAIGQFFSSRRKGVAEALKTALYEVEAMKLRADRLEAEMHKTAQDMAELKAENVTLRSLLTGGQPILDALQRTKEDVETFARLEHEKTRALIEEIRNTR